MLAVNQVFFLSAWRRFALVSFRFFSGHFPLSGFFSLFSFF